ncbi:unnamed protein product [Vicia faba]|uniref:Uncharacterized protein n=1 Tax=Vicia faba TaxID=3906 RepID=A0AAV0YMJ2_VICFA|nr:unnamed protein product [Vicia faba]
MLVSRMCFFDLSIPWLDKLISGSDFGFDQSSCIGLTLIRGGGLGERRKGRCNGGDDGNWCWPRRASLEKMRKESRAAPRKREEGFWAKKHNRRYVSTLSLIVKTTSLRS